MAGNATDEDVLDGLVSNARLLVGILSLLTFTLVVTNVCHKSHVPIPESILTVMIGCVCGAIGFSLPEFASSDFLRFEELADKQFMLIYISPIIFAEGYGMKSKRFFENVTRICAHAFLGTTISTVIVAAMVFYLPKLTGFGGDIGVAECLAFGALISATDPVTTLAIFKELGMVEGGLAHLYYSVLGESILNDAVAITLFDGFSEYVKDEEDFTASSIGPLCVRFMFTFIGSMAIGIFSGIFCALLLKVARLNEREETEEHVHFNVAEMGTMLLMSYLPFVIATALPPMSSIVAVLFAGIAMRRYSHYNLTSTTRKVFLPCAELLAGLAEAYIFLLLGLGVFILNDYNFSFLCWTVLACLVARAVQVYPLALTVNCFSRARQF